jgi:hypothetical protein
MREDKCHAAEDRMTKAMRDYHNGFEIPDGKPAWQLMSERLAENKPRRLWRPRLKLAAGAAAFLIVFHLVYGAVHPVQGISRYFLNMQFSPSGSTLSIGDYERKNDSGMLTAPPPLEDHSGKMVPSGEKIKDAAGNGLQDEKILEFSTVKEAAGKTSYPIVEPAYLPEGAGIVRVVISLAGEAEKTWRAALHYSGKSGGQEFQLVQELTTGMKGSLKPEELLGSAGKKVKIGAHSGILAVSSDGSYTELQWETGTRRYLLGGSLTEQEILAIAESVK